MLVIVPCSEHYSFINSPYTDWVLAERVASNCENCEFDDDL